MPNKLRYLVFAPPGLMAAWMQRNRVLKSVLALGFHIVKCIASMFNRDRAIQSQLLMLSMVAFISVCMVPASLFVYFDPHSSRQETTLNYIRCALLSELFIVVAIVVTLIQLLTHCVNGSPLFPKNKSCKFAIVLLQSIFSQLIQGGSGATSCLHDLIHFANPNLKTDFTERLRMFSQWVSISSGLYSVVSYLTSRLAENDISTEEEAQKDSVSSWTLVPRLLQSSLGAWAAYTMRTSADYSELHAFNLLVVAYWCLVGWNVLTIMVIILAYCCSLQLDQRMDTIVWLMDSVIVSFTFTALCGAGSVVVFINYDLDQCQSNNCPVFIKSVMLALGCYVCTYVPSLQILKRKVKG